MQQVKNTLIGSRLRLEMQQRGLTAAQLAKRADVKTSFLYDILNGKSANPSPIQLMRISDNLGVGLAYLLGNTDNAALGEYSSISLLRKDYVTVPHISFDTTSGAAVTCTQERNRYCFRTEWIEKHLNASPDDLRIFYVQSDSMEPGLRHNDAVLIDTARKCPSPPGVFLLFDGAGLAVKRLEYISGPAEQRIRIMSDNPRYSAYERSAEEIIGRVVWFAREI